MLGVALTAWERREAAAPMLSLTMGPLARRPACSHPDVTICHPQLHCDQPHLHTGICPGGAAGRLKPVRWAQHGSNAREKRGHIWPAHESPTARALVILQPHLATVPACSAAVSRLRALPHQTHPLTNRS